MRQQLLPTLVVVLVLGACAGRASAQVLDWAAGAGGPFGDLAPAVAVDGAGNAHIAGRFEALATFGAGEPNETVLTSAGSFDAFVAKYDRAGQLLWAKRAGGVGFDWVTGLDVDDAGGVYATGWFAETAVFGAGEPGETTLATAGDRDVFVARFDQDGMLTWARRAGGTFGDAGFGISLDGTGAGCVIGWFSGTAVFGAGEPNETMLSSAGSFDLFLARYDGAGLLSWATRAGGVALDEGTAVALDADGHCHVTGRFEGTATFGAGAPNQTTLTSAGAQDVFVAEYGADGLLVWATRAGGPGSDEGYGIAVAAGESRVTGRFEGTAVFGEGEPGETALASAGFADTFVARFDGSGSLAWARRAGGIDPDEAGRGIAVGDGGDTYLAGHFQGLGTFGPGEPNETQLQAAGQADVFVAKLDGAGLLTWVVRAGGLGTDRGHGLALDDRGNAYATGTFLTTAIFGPGESRETELTSFGNSDVFVAKLAHALLVDGFESGDTSGWSETEP